MKSPNSAQNDQIVPSDNSIKLFIYRVLETSKRMAANLTKENLLHSLTTAIKNASRPAGRGDRTVVNYSVRSSIIRVSGKFTGRLVSRNLGGKWMR